MLRYEAIKEENLDQVAGLYNDFLKDLGELTGDPYFNFKELDFEDRKERLENNYSNNRGLVLVAKDETEVVGFVSCLVADCFLVVSSIKKIGYIEGTYVKPEYRGRGITSRLEQLAVEYLKTEKVDYLELCIISNNEHARKCWEKLGYQTFREQMRKKI